VAGMIDAVADLLDQRLLAQLVEQFGRIGRRESRIPTRRAWRPCSCP
jgi:hypothetical protein